MGKLYCIISALLIAIGSIYAVEPAGYEWWIDNDVSGVRSGAFTAGKLDLKIDTSDLPRGVHYFNCRLNTADGVWGAVYRRMFFAIGKDDGAVGYEYWFDNEYDTRESGTLTEAKKSFKVDMSTLTPGVHYFNCRLNSSENEWGSVFRTMIYAAGSTQDVSGYEYWFDNDYPSKESGDISGGIKSFTISASTLSPGVHYFNCRLRTTDGKWGAVYRKMVFTTPTGIDAAAYEYWIDNNYESKTEGDLAEGSNTYTVGLSGLRRGLHRFNYRIRTGAGVWGSVYSNYFYIDPNSSFPKTFEYWLDDDYAGRETMTSSSNNVSFKMDLSGFDKAAAKPHFFNLRVYDEGYPESSAFYRKLIVPFKGIKAPIVGYRHFLNGAELGYVEVERQSVESYLFDIELPDSVRPTVKNRRPSFDGDKVFIAGADSIDYAMQIRTELGWAPPKNWKLGISNEFTTDAVAMEINSRHTFATPTTLEFAAMKFTASGDSLYLRSDIPVALDIYREGEKVAALTPAQVKGMTMLKLTEGEYFGVLYGVEDSDAKEFTLHLMDTPNQVPMPTIAYEDETVTISCTREDAVIRYSLDGNDPDEESTLYTEPFPLKRNAAVKAKAWVERSDIEPSAVAEYIVDSYKVAAPVADFNLAARELTLTSETKEAAIVYTHEYDESDSEGGVWTDYETPIRIRKNGTVYSRATHDGYKDSDITVTEITTLPDSVPMPVIEFEKGIVTISCDEKDAEIHYTLDGTRPNAGSTLYEGAFPLRRNATVMAFAYMPDLDIDSSRVATRVIDSYKVAEPKGSFDVRTRLLTLTCDTVGAAIYYSFERNGQWTPYSATERIRMRKNGTVYAKATFDGYNDSDVVEIVVSELPDEVLPPVILCDGNGRVSISCDTEGAEIRYSFDAEEPSMESMPYEDPFFITRNVRVNAFAYIADLDIEPSTVSSIMCDIFHVADLTYDFDPESRTLTLGCATEGATILYTFDPDRGWTEYTWPIGIRKNCTLYAKAVRDGYYESQTETITINSLADSVPVPEISFADGMVDITCSNADAEIHYTVDDPNLSVESPVFTEQFALDRNATVRALALIPGLDIEPSDPVTKVIDSFKVATPTWDFDVKARELTLSCGTEKATVFYSFTAEGNWTEYIAPISITKNRTVYAKATRDGWNDSDVAQIVISDMKCDGVTFDDYNGRYVSLRTTEKDATIRYTIDDSEPSGGAVYNGPLDVEGLCTVRAIAVKDGYMNSDEAELQITFYADEEHAETADEGLLASAFGWNGELPNNVSEFRIEGRLNDADYAFIRSMGALRHLDLEDVADAHIPEYAFGNSKLISISMPEDIAECGDSIFSGAPLLSSVVWNSRTMNVEEGQTLSLSNPNVLLYVPAEANISGRSDLNIVREGIEPSVTLRYGYPFYAARDFKAERVSLTHDFRQTTAIDTCRGWETFVLPFSPNEITHEVNGPVIPFAARNEDIDGDKPFWLYRATASGWEAAESIEACVPYIISMPNNPDYVPDFNLGGKVTFSAEGVHIGPDRSLAESYSWVDGTLFEGTFMPMEEIGIPISSLNVGSNEGGYEPGSTFLRSGTTLPFGAYVSGSIRKAMPLFGGYSSADMMLRADDSLVIETPAPGVLRIHSGRERKVAVTTATGLTVRTLRLKPGEAATLEGLTRDLYIVAGRKVMVR